MERFHLESDRRALPGTSGQDVTTGSRNGHEDTVTVVVTTFNDSAFLAQALVSVIAQTIPVHEVIVVDDGSDESPEAIVSSFPGCVLLQKENGGLSSARNVGLQAAASRFITFLDADDLYEPDAIATGLACFAQNPTAAMVFGGYRRVHEDGRPAGRDHFKAGGSDIYADLLRVNFIGMHATVLYRREVLLNLGGFDETLRMSEDYDAYLRLARRYPIASHPDIIAKYRRHAHNMSNNNPKMLHAVLAVHERHRMQTGPRRRAWHDGQRNWNAWYTTEQSTTVLGGGVMGTVTQLLRRVGRSIARRAKKRLRGGRLHRLYRGIRRTYPPPVGMVNMGSLNTTKPISMDFGYERGNPVDRYYIENFLEAHSADIAGHVLDVAEDTYIKAFGGPKVTKQDVLHYSLTDDPITIVGDMTQPGTLPDNTFDCIIFTQTLQLIFEMDKAVASLYAALKPGGVLLFTVPGISQIERTDWHHYWCWSFTESSVRQLFQKKFAPENMKVETLGNVYAAITFLHGIALEEVDKAKLDVKDQAYPVIITLRAVKD